MKPVSLTDTSLMFKLVTKITLVNPVTLRSSSVNHNIHHPIVPGQPVNHLNAYAFNATSITITWNPPAQANGVIAYRVYISYGNTSKILACDTNQTLCDIFNLQEHHSYQIAVLVYNIKYQLILPTQVMTSVRTPSAGKFHKIDV